MSSIGIITNPKNKEYMTKVLSKEFDISQMIFITDKNFKGIKKIKFETIIIDSSINNIRNLKEIIQNATYIVLNSDLIRDYEIFGEMNIFVISYGFNSKSTFTVSSISENNIIICLQRIITNIFNVKYEPQEIQVKNDEGVDIYTIISSQILILMYKKIHVLEN